MRYAMIFGIALLFLAGMIGCGGSPVPEIIEQEKAWRKELEEKGDPLMLVKRREELDARINSLSTDQKADYDKKMSELGFKAREKATRGGKGGS
jgi:hypothetical protein